ncbi:MAG: pilus assembly protein N-terminal domain-containing protein, partial [Candidatus Eremiobacteraeota bacterium]|nr:pilus assembly protein N-terminal domain-containing protein [Candidatus Eremiobacteraeota bacterium]
MLPATGAVPVGEKQVLQISSVMGDVTLVVANPSIVDAAIDQVSRTLTLTGKVPGATTVTVKDARGLTKDIPVRVAFLAGTIAREASLRLTGVPASSDYVKTQAVALAKRLASARTGAQIVATIDQVTYASSLAPDNVVSIGVPV